MCRGTQMCVFRQIQTENLTRVQLKSNGSVNLKYKYGKFSSTSLACFINGKVFVRLQTYDQLSYGIGVKT